MAVERNSLPGNPSNKLIRDVRQVLWTYFSIKPPKTGSCKLWRDVWEWAWSMTQIKSINSKAMRIRYRWPDSSEIATQYVLLGLLEMRTSSRLRLPKQSSESMPPCIAARFADFQRMEALRDPEFRLKSMPIIGALPG